MRAAEPPAGWGRADRACTHWQAADGPHGGSWCGRRQTVEFLPGPRCWDHTPAALAGHPEPLGGPGLARIPIGPGQTSSDKGRISAGNTTAQKRRAEEQRAAEILARRSGTRTGLDHPMTSHLAMPRERSVRLEVFAMVAAWQLTHGGLTDDELERALNRSHQTVSAARNGLVGDGYLESSGLTRPTRTGNAATVWRVAPAGAPLAAAAARRARRLPGADGPE